MFTKRKNLNEYDWNAFYKEFQNESPRAAVIISGAFLDALLRDLIASFMIESDKVVDELLGNEKNFEAPLATFGARIKAAYCLGLISKKEFDDLRVIQKIRNRFAHKLHGYTFSEAEIVDWCDKLQTSKDVLDALELTRISHRDKFVITVSMLLSQIGLKILSIQNERRTIKSDIRMGEIVKA